MKKTLCALLALLMCLCLAACGTDIPVENASAADKQAVIDAAKTCLASTAFNGYLDLYATLTGEARSVPEIADALTYHCDDFEGHTLNLIFFRVKADVACIDGATPVIYDSVLFAIDTDSGTVYDSITHQEGVNSFDGTVESIEDAIFACLCSPVVMSAEDGIIWTETETSSRFTKADLKDLNAALAQ